ncbi:hypothetical protein SDC9_153933 [bioreactor metagenome]|uniref:Uncharacterized protein n=1 Tax=bioreactor metagenome TaxID=1076179 RepID=A0A645EXP7_9ZZZZ
MIFAACRHRPDFHRHAEEPLPQIKLVRTLVEQYAAAFAPPGRPPVAGVVIVLAAEPVGDDPADSPDGAEFPGIDQLFELPVHGRGPEIEHGRFDRRRILLRRAQQSLCLGLVDRNRFFHDQMLARRHGADRQVDVTVMRRGDNHRVNRSFAEKAFRIVEGPAIRRQTGRNPLQRRGADIADCGQFGQVDFFDEFNVGRTHVADSDDAETHPIHKFRPLG